MLFFHLSSDHWGFWRFFYDSPEMNCSIFFSMHMLWMTKKIHHSLRYFIIGERKFPWFNISPIPFPNGDYSWWGAGRFSSLWLCFWPLIGMQNISHPVFNAYSSRSTSGISVSLLFKFITNVFDPWEILTQEWVLSLFKDQILISTPYLPCKQLVASSNTGPIFVLQPSEILHPYNFYSIYLVVTAFQFVLHIVAIENFDTLGHHNPKELLSWSHWARVRNFIIVSLQRVAPSSREGIHTLHISPRLLRKDWADLQRQLCEK